MNDQQKKAALRMISNGVYILGVAHEGEVEGATITWLSQASFKPPLIMMGLKKDGRPYELLKQGRTFALSFLEKGQRDLAFAFFKEVDATDTEIGGYAYETADTGAPILLDAPAWLEGKVVSTDETGDHVVVVGEVTNAAVRREAEPLTLEELGLKYGG